MDSRAGPKSEKGIELRDDVHNGQDIGIYARNIISESTAQIKDKVWAFGNRKDTILKFSLKSCRPVGTIVITTKAAAAQTLDQTQTNSDTWIRILMSSP